MFLVKRATPLLYACVLVLTAAWPLRQILDGQGSRLWKRLRKELAIKHEVELAHTPLAAGIQVKKALGQPSVIAVINH